MKKFFFFCFLVGFIGYTFATPFQYYKLTITSNGWSGAQFMDGFSGFSDANATGTNIFYNYGSLYSESTGWIWRGKTFLQMASFQAGCDPYIPNGYDKWFIFRLDQARTISSFKLGNYLAEGSRWWIESIVIEASNDNISYQTLYSGAVSTAQTYTTINIQINVPEISSILFFVLGLSSIFLRKK